MVMNATEVAAKIYAAVLRCGHDINAERVILLYDAGQPGPNALHQLDRRIKEVAQEACKQPEWVRCSERLPENGEAVYFVRAGSKHIYIGTRQDGEHPAFVGMTGSRYFDHNKNDVLLWMPRWVPAVPSDDLVRQTSESIKS